MTTELQGSNRWENLFLDYFIQLSRELEHRGQAPVNSVKVKYHENVCP